MCVRASRPCFVQLLVDWTYYEEGECEDRIDASFYGPCYKDAGSFENIQQEVQDAVMNTFTGGIEVKEGDRSKMSPGMVLSSSTPI